MVGIKHLILLAATIVLGLANTYGQNTLGSFAERQTRQLTMRRERVQQTLAELRNSLQQTPCDSTARIVYELEKQCDAIDAAIEKLAAQNTQPTTSQELSTTTETPLANEETTVDTVPPTPEVELPIQQPAQEEQTPFDTTAEPSEKTDNKPNISNNLKSLFTTASRRYALIEKEIDGLIGSYATCYHNAEIALDGYAKSTSLQTLEQHYADYLTSLENGEKVAREIISRSDRLIESKLNSYIGFADSLGMAVQDEYNEKMAAIEDAMYEKFNGKCSNTDIAIYPHRLHQTLLFEIELAEHIAPEMTDSLRVKAENYDFTSTLFAPIGQPKRSDIKFAAVKVDKKSKHIAVSALPQIKIPSQGELYSITVANYASLPTSTKVFRNVKPLYRDRREDGRTYICIGLYPTALSAQDDIAYLRKLGFKQPELVMWRDGIRRDDYIDRSKPTTSGNKPAMYRVEISGVTGGALPEEVIGIIRQTAPNKEISKFTADSNTIFTVGIFTKESEAHKLASAIGADNSGVTATVSRIGKK